MRVLVLSDSHSSPQFMRRCMEKIRPDAVVHLGDYYKDGQALAEHYPNIPLYQVAGNCDEGRCPINARLILNCRVCGVMMYMTHGHVLQVHQGVGGLVAEARRNGAQVALYGHTHIPDCHREEDGLWVFNPGSAGREGNSAGVLETDGQAVTACYFLSPKDLEGQL